MSFLFPPVPAPPLWDDFRTIAERGPGPRWFGFEDDWTLVHRFNARYRLARSCTGLKTTGYTGTTERGYDSLTRALLAWSTLELFRRLALIKTDAALAALLDKHGAAALLKTIQSVAGFEKFFGEIEKLSSKKCAAQIHEFVSGRPCDPGKVLGAVRHIFAHGFLTPNAGKIEPTESATICHRMADFLLDTVDVEWAERINQGIADWLRAGH